MQQKWVLLSKKTCLQLAEVLYSTSHMFNPDCFKALVQQPYQHMPCTKTLLQYLQQCNALAFLYNLRFMHTPQYAPFPLHLICLTDLEVYYLALPQVHVHKRAHPLASAARKPEGSRGVRLFRRHKSS